MSYPFQRGSSGLPDSDSPAGASGHPRSRYASPDAAAPSASAGATNFYSHPSRTSILNSGGDLAFDSASSFPGSSRRDQADMDAAANGNSAGAWRASGSLPSFSRAFDMFTTADDEDDATQAADERFFVPSYLEGSTYVQQLEEAHKARVQAQREAKRKSANDLSRPPVGFPQPSLPPGSHRGMSHTVIERPPPFEEEDAVAPLPMRWNKEDMWTGIEVQADGLGVKYVGPKNPHDRDHEACAVRTDHFMPPQCGIYYYEVQIISGRRDDTTIAIGFATKTASLSRPVGWEPESWGYHGDDGRCFTGQNIGRPFGPMFNTGDVIGCGVNFRDQTSFFTKNGVKIGLAFHDVVRGRLHPAISLKKPGEQVLANFGQTPFVYNIDDMMKEQREKVQKDIDATDTSRLEPGMSETDLIQTLVLQFLQHDGYVETARAFAEDMKVQKEALNLDPNVKVAGVNIKDDEDANNRQRIRRAILEGDIDRALKYTNAYYPQVLQDNEQVYFTLRCRRFIEMVRKAAQMNMANESKGSNGHAARSSSQDMDLDLNGGENPAWVEGIETDGAASEVELMELERSMLDYGQSLQAEYANDTRREVTQALNDIWALVAYPNPLKEPQVSHLLDRKGRVTVAEELNSAILSSLGKSSRASLEKLYAQTSVLLDTLRQEGGPGAFVSVQDVVGGIPRLP